MRISDWSSDVCSSDLVTCHHGPAGLAALLQRAEILVCLLPLTPETTGILNRDLFAQLPEGACLVNAGRGQHLVEEDLIPALDSGRLGGATLDVLRVEPAAPDHHFWSHPKILLTPPIASLLHPDTGPRLLPEPHRRLQADHPGTDTRD